MVADPDVINRRVLGYCNGCGSDWSEILEKLLGRRQVIDIPPIVRVVTEQQIYARTCACSWNSQNVLEALGLIARGGFALQT